MAKPARLVQQTFDILDYAQMSFTHPGFSLIQYPRCDDINPSMLTAAENSRTILMKSGGLRHS